MDGHMIYMSIYMGIVALVLFHIIMKKKKVSPADLPPHLKTKRKRNNIEAIKKKKKASQ